MPNFSLRSQSVLEPNNPDQSIGSFPNRDTALENLNRGIGDDGKPCNAYLTIKAFAFEDAGTNIFWDRKYYLVETVDGKEVLHRLFPKEDLGFDSYKTSHAAGSFTV